MNIINEMAYPSNFDLQEFSKLPTFRARLKYCDERLQKLGSGSSRTVYKVDDQKVLKIAKNQKGLAQNEAEMDWGRNNYGVFGIIYEADTENNTWIEMELASKARASDFQRILGVSWEETTALIDYIFSLSSKCRYPMYFNERIKNLYEKLIVEEESEFFLSLNMYIFDYQPWSVNDWTVLNNWGIVKRNGKEELVIIDDGLSEDVWNNYYAKRRR